MFLFAIQCSSMMEDDLFEYPPCTFNYTITYDGSQDIKQETVFKTEGLCLTSTKQQLLIVMNEFSGCKIHSDFYSDANFKNKVHSLTFDESTENWNSIIDFSDFWAKIYIKPTYTTSIYFKAILPTKGTYSSHVLVSNLITNDIYLSKGQPSGSQYRTSMYDGDLAFFIMPTKESYFDIDYDLDPNEFIDVLSFGIHNKRLTGIGVYSFQVVEGRDFTGYFSYHMQSNASSDHVRFKTRLNDETYKTHPTISYSDFIDLPLKQWENSTIFVTTIAIVFACIIAILLASCLIMAQITKKNPPPPDEGLPDDVV